MTPWAEYAKIVADVFKALIWPIATLYVFMIFRGEISNLLKNAKEFTVGVAGVEVRFTASEAGSLLADVLIEVNQATCNFSDVEWRLFSAIANAPKPVQVNEIILSVFGTDFKRNSPEHEALRNLRNASLVRPDEGGPWRTDKHAGLTTLGRLVQSNRSRHPV